MVICLPSKHETPTLDNGIWWYTVFPALGRQVKLSSSRLHSKFNASLGYMGHRCVKIIQEAKCLHVFSCFIIIHIVLITICSQIFGLLHRNFCQLKSYFMNHCFPKSMPLLEQTITCLKFYCAPSSCR